MLETGNTVYVLDNFQLENLTIYNQIETSEFKIVEGDLLSFHIVHDAVNDCEFLHHPGALPTILPLITDPITSYDFKILGNFNVFRSS